MTEPTFYTLEQLAKMLEVSERTIMREIKAGKLRAFKVGRALRFTSDAVREYVQRQEVKPEADLDSRQEAHSGGDLTTDKNYSIEGYL